MKKLLGIASAAALMTALSVNVAHADMYIEGGGGITTQDQLDWDGSAFDMDDGWNAGVAIGHSTGSWDLEGEFSYNEMEYSCCNPNNTHEYRLMGNATYNFSVGGFTPYLGGGVGAAFVTYENSSSETEATVAAYQLIGGLRVPLGDTWSLFGEYRYQGTFENPEDGGLEWEHDGHNWVFGARLNLN